MSKLFFIWAEGAINLSQIQYVEVDEDGTATVYFLDEEWVDLRDAEFVKQLFLALLDYNETSFRN